MSHSSHNILKRPVLIPDNRLHCIMTTKFRFASVYNRKKVYANNWNKTQNTENVSTRKRGNCECIATWGRPTPSRCFSALITTPCQVWSRWTYPLPYYRVFAADTLLYAVTSTFDPVILTVDLWPWTFAMYRLWRDVYQKFERNRTIRGAVNAISIFDLMTLNAM